MRREAANRTQKQWDMEPTNFQGSNISKQLLKSEQSYPSSLNTNLAKKQDLATCSTEQKNRLRRWRALDLNLCVSSFFLRPLSLWRFVLDFSGEIAFLYFEVILISRTSTETQRKSTKNARERCVWQKAKRLVLERTRAENQ